MLEKLKSDNKKYSLNISTKEKSTSNLLLLLNNVVKKGLTNKFFLLKRYFYQ